VTKPGAAVALVIDMAEHLRVAVAPRSCGAEPRERHVVRAPGSAFAVPMAKGRRKPAQSPLGYGR
jgi:hypothetical protein